MIILVNESLAEVQSLVYDSPTASIEGFTEDFKERPDD